MGATLAVALFGSPAQASMHWVPAPVKHAHGGMHDRNAPKQFLLVEGEGAATSLIDPKVVETALESVKGRVAVRATGMDNYHALVASRSYENIHESAVRYIYFHGKPSGESPSLLTAHEKATLEIEPAPLAREHWRYYGNTAASFIVRFKGEPLADATVAMATDNGTRAKFKTDAQGRVSIPLPDDFKRVKSSRIGNRPSEFRLITAHQNGGESYLFTFSSAYHVNPEHWQSTSLGVATMAGGMLLGGLVSWCTRRRKEK